MNPLLFPNVISISPVKSEFGPLHYLVKIQNLAYNLRTQSVLPPVASPRHPILYSFAAFYWESREPPEPPLGANKHTSYLTMRRNSRLVISEPFRPSPSPDAHHTPFISSHDSHTPPPGSCHPPGSCQRGWGSCQGVLSDRSCQGCQNYFLGGR